jgi:hypothetical protein
METPEWQQWHGEAMEAWRRAANEHLDPKPGTVVYLAYRFRAWRKLEQSHPKWRREEPSTDWPTLESLTAYFEFKKLQPLAIEYERQRYEAECKQDYKFFARLAKAMRRLFDDKGVILTTSGAVLETWRMQFFATGCKYVTQRRIRLLIEGRMKELNKRPITDKQWRRVFSDPFIAALFRCHPDRQGESDFT